MPPDPLQDEEDEQYASEEDSDFAPDQAAADAASEQSESESEAAPAESKRKRPAAKQANAEDAGYDNSGDEAIIKRGKKKRRKAKDGVAGDEEGEEGGEGGLVKTRRQRAAEKEERRYAANSEPVTVDVDAIWSQMLSGQYLADAKADEAANGETVDGEHINGTIEGQEANGSKDEPSEMIRIKRVTNFAGKTITEEKLVHRDSAEARHFIATYGEDAVLPDADVEPTKRATRKAFRSVFEPLSDNAPLRRTDLNLGMAARMQAGQEARATKLNTVEKSRMDWAGYVDKEGIKDELALAGKSKESYNAREDFLARSEARRDEDARRVRLSGKT